MERGIYFDAWYHDHYCFHPSLPFRSMEMIHDLEKYHATILVWSALGGGSISLPYLENEAFGEVDPRLRFHGFMNDSEFIAACRERGIKVLGIVFEVQGWEFPAVLSEDGKSFLALNELGGKSAETYYGLNEFSSDQYPDLFRTSLKDYYPEGIVDENGEKVTRLQEEGCARTWKGEPVHAGWVEVEGHTKTCYQMCRNNPVWRNYLKKIIALQIDAGVSGIQLDEAELPITSMGAGGCFCRHCMKGFREYLQEKRRNHTLDEALYQGIDLETFDYRQYVLDGQYEHPNDSPLIHDYYDFQMRAVKKYFTELVDFARTYAREKQNRKILVSGNFFTCMPVYYPIENTVDLIITEMDHTLFHKPEWYRYINGFSGKKQIIVAENPYGGIIPDLQKLWERGKGFDLYRLLLLEATVYGCNMSVPYGGWMGNSIRTGLWPPKEVTVQVEDFLSAHDDLLSKDSGANVMVVYSFPSNYWREVTKGDSGNQFTDVNQVIHPQESGGGEAVSSVPFWEVSRRLCRQHALYDVRMFGDDELRKDPVSSADWKAYRLIILPGCEILTDDQREALTQYVREGGKVLAFGTTARGNEAWFEAFRRMDGVVYIPQESEDSMARFEDAFAAVYRQIQPVKIGTEDPEDLPWIGIGMHRSGQKQSLHLLNYHYAAQEDSVLPIQGVTLEITRKDGMEDVLIYDLDGNTIPASVRTDQEHIHIEMTLPLYAVIEWKGNQEET